MYYYFIVNPNSGAGKGLKIWNQAKTILNKKNAEYEVYFTTGTGDGRKKARELTSGRKDEIRIIAIGGDGTMNEVLDGVSFGCPVILGYIPSGSGNDLAKGLGLQRNIKKLIEKILNPDEDIDTIDYGVLSCAEYGCIRRFIVSAGIGFDAAVCHDILDKRLKDKMGRSFGNKTAYVASGVKEYLLSKPSKGYIILDGERKVELKHILFISAHIHPYEGGGFKFAPNADDKDGKLELCVVSNKNKLKLIPTLLSAKGGKLKNTNGVRFFSCKEAHIHIDRPLAVHTDGENCNLQTDIDFHCVNGQLRFIR